MLKQQEPLKRQNKKIKCCIGNKLIAKNEIYYKCGSEYGCWGNYIVCHNCFEYGILKFMMEICRGKKYNSLTRLEKYEVDKQIREYNLENPLSQYQKRKNKNKGIHFYSSYPNHYDENFHSPISSDNDCISTTQTIMEMNNERKFGSDDSDDDSSSDDSNSDDSDSDDSDSDSDSDNDNKKKKKRERKDSDEAPNFKQGKGRNFMNYILTKQEYWYGFTLLTEKEWREIYWMDIGMQLRWLIMLRQNVFQQVSNSLMSQGMFDQHIINILMEMICGTPKVTGCFLNL